MAPGRIALLQAMPIFGALRDDAIEVLLDGAPTVARARGAFYFHEGDAAQCMYVIEEGTVEVQKHWEGGEYPLHQLHAGDCFGEMALMDFFPRRCALSKTAAPSRSPPRRCTAWPSATSSSSR